MKKLLTTQTTNGSSEAFTWRGGRGLMIAAGTWGSATLTLQISPDAGTTWLSMSITLTANGSVAFEAPPCSMRLTVSGVTTTSLNAWIGWTESH